MKPSSNKLAILTVLALPALTTMPCRADVPPQFLFAWGSAGSSNGQFNAPSGLALSPDGHIYVVDGFNYRIQIFDTSGVYLAHWGTAGSGPGQFAQGCKGVAINPSGTVYIADTENHRIQVFDASGQYLSQWGSPGSGNGQFSEPYGLALDPNGNVYVADRNNHRIQKFDGTGNYLAQWGTFGSGNGQFKEPLDVAVSASGHVFAADRLNHRIQEFDTTGAYLWQWGTKGSGNSQFTEPNGVGVDANGSVFVSDSGNHRIQKFDPSGTYLTQWGTPGSGDGQFNWPVRTLATPNGHVYVTDFFNARIEGFGPCTHTGSSTISSDPQSQVAVFGTAARFTISATDVQYIKWRKNQVPIPGANDSVFTIASVALGDSGYYDAVASNCFGADTSATAQLVVTCEGGIPAVTQDPLSQTVPLGSTATFTAAASRPASYQWRKDQVPIAGGSGTAYTIGVVTAKDIGSYDVIISNPCGSDTSVTAFLGATCVSKPNVLVNPRSQSVGWATSVTFAASATNWPLYQWRKNRVSIAGANDSTYTIPMTTPSDVGYYDCVASNPCGTDSSAIAFLSLDAQCVLKWGTLGSGDGQFTNPFGIGVDASGHVYVTDVTNNRIQKFAPDSTFVMKWGSRGSGDGQFGIGGPRGVVVDKGGNIYVLDNGNSRIEKFGPDSTFLAKWGGSGSADGQLSSPLGLAVDDSGNVYVADNGNARIDKFSSDGLFLAKWGTAGAGPGQFAGLFGVAVDDSGNVYTVESANHRVQKFASDASFLMKWGSYGSSDGQFLNPQFIATDSRGDIYVSDVSKHQVQEFAPDSSLITEWGSLGDGLGQFRGVSPRGIAVDANFNSYVVDNGNHRIEKFTSTLVTGTGDTVSRPKLRLAPPIPNPWSTKTSLGFSLVSAGRTSVAIYDVQGRLLKRWLWATLPAGPHRVDWDGRTDHGAQVPNGVLFYRLEANGETRTQKMVHLR